jgi:hypothetical protein
MDDDFKIPFERGDDHLLGDRTQTVLKKMSAPDGALADNDSLRV